MPLFQKAGGRYVLFWALTAAACADRALPTAPTSAVSFTTYASTSLVFRHTALDAATIANTAALVEQAAARIRADSGSPALPTVTITLHPSLDSLLSAIIGSVGTVPTFATGFLTGPDAVHILSPNLTGQWSYETGLTGIVHEVAHCASLRLNPGFGNNPRWLWETFALFHAGQIVDPRRVPALATRQAPAFAQLNDINDRLVYDVGGVLGEYIVATWGHATLAAMVRENGNVLQATGLSEPEFLQRWMAFLDERY